MKGKTLIKARRRRFLRVLLKYYSKECKTGLHPPGLCIAILNCKGLNSLEQQELHTYFESQRPTWYRHIRFYYKRIFINQDYWWKPYFHQNERKKFIKYLYKINEN